MTVFKKIAELAHEADASGYHDLADKLDLMLGKIAQPYSDELVDSGMPGRSQVFQPEPIVVDTSKPQVVDMAPMEISVPKKKSVAEHHRKIEELLRKIDPGVGQNLGGADIKRELKRLVGLDTAQPGMTWGKIYKALNERKPSPARMDNNFVLPDQLTSDNLRKDLQKDNLRKHLKP